MNHSTTMNASHPRYHEYRQCLESELTLLAKWCFNRNTDKSAVSTAKKLHQKNRIIQSKLLLIELGYRVKPLVLKDGKFYRATQLPCPWLRYKCACGKEHQIAVEPKAGATMHYQWNRSLDHPTITGDIMFISKDGQHRCHHSINNGEITYHPESTHRFKNQKLKLYYI